MVDEAGGEPTTISSQLGNIEAFAWSPDGETFAYGGISTLTTDEPNPREFVDGVVADFSPDGDHLLYLDEEARLVAQPIDGGEAVTIEVEMASEVGFGGNVDWLDCS